MTVNAYIQQRFQTFGISLSEADLFDMCLNARISGEGEMNKDCYGLVAVAIAKFTPLYCYVLLRSVKAASRCLGTFKVLRTTILSCVRSTG